MPASLEPGADLGAFRIVSQLGRGGMGEVYQAHDRRLGRDVAIKVLPVEVARDPDRRARFEQEARAASALNHPNVLTVFDLGYHDDAPYLVCELLDGESLRTVIDRGPLPRRQALDYGRQIAARLAATHAHGIVHRDIKPENLFITSDGRVKILDFGVAKVVTPSAPDDATNANLTTAGTVVGTVAYMSPEQVQARPVDARSDIFSMGAVLFEMLTGRPPFTGDSSIDVMHAITRHDPPDLDAMLSEPAPLVSRIVARCMAKAPGLRFQSASDLEFAIEAAAGSASGIARQPTHGATPSAGHKRPVWAAVALAAGGLALAAAMWPATSRPSAPGSELPTRLSVMPPAGTSFGHIALSPDGRWLAFTATSGARRRLWVRALSSDTATAIDATDGAAYPFWSPDSRSIAFFASGRLRTVSVEGGTPLAIAEVANGTGGTWNTDGQILFSGLALRRILRVAASGGPVSVAVAPLSGQTDLHDPYFLPDGQQFLYMADGSPRESTGVYIASIGGGAPRKLLPDDTNVTYVEVARGEGLLVFSRDGALVAQPFTPETAELRGAPVPLAPRVGEIFGATTSYRSKAFTTSAQGLLVFDGVPDRQQSRVLWMDRRGTVLRRFDTLDAVNRVDLAPDDRRFLVSRNRPANNNDLWLADVESDAVTRFTFDLGNDQFGLWSPDGRSVVWASNRQTGVFNLFTKDAASSGQDRVLFQNEQYKFPLTFSHDGRSLLYRTLDRTTGNDIWVLPLVGDAVPAPVLRSAAIESYAALSPDDRWMAYQSDESGRFEVYLQRFGGDGKRQVSMSGGVAPVWRRDGRELLYYAEDGRLMAVPVSTTGDLVLGAPSPLFEFVSYGSAPSYSVSRDGERFLVSTVLSAADTPMTVVQNWVPGVRKE